jgi:Ca2+-binding RTX toxin-like protein
VLTAGGGNDSLWGWGGGDSFYGAEGNDYVVGGAGADYFDGGAGTDTVSYYFASGGVTVYLDGRGVNTGEALGDQFVGVENVLGSAYADTLCGTAGANVLTAGGGNDSLWGWGGGDSFYGAEGNDYVVGGAGADYFDGGAGTDTVSYYFASGGVTVYLDGRGANTGEALGDRFFGVENVLGSAYADTLCGTTGANVLTGGGGNDALIGGSGNDVLSGGSGADNFVWQTTDLAAPGNPDTDVIIDFDRLAGDKLDFNRLIDGDVISNFDAYFHFERVGNDTMLSVCSDGNYFVGASASEISGLTDCRVLFQGVDLIASGNLHDLFSPMLI